MYGRSVAFRFTVTTGKEHARGFELRWEAKLHLIPRCLKPCSSRSPPLGRGMIQVMGRAATGIQARWRGMACRMALARRATEDALGKRRTVSAVTIQTAARRRAAIAKHGPRLTLGDARRKREARAAAEAARPRRRWNRGGPAAGPGSVTAAPPPAGTGAAAGAGGSGGGSGGGGVAKVAASASQPVASSYSGGAASSSSSTAASSSRKKLEKRDIADKEPARAWEQGPPNPAAEAGRTSDGGGGGGGGDSGDSDPTSNSERKDDGSDQRSSLCASSGAGDEGRGDENLDSGGLPAAKKGASEEATLRFVRESIHAAVIKAGARVSIIGGEVGVGVALATSNVAGDSAATKVLTETAVPATAAAAAAAAADGDLSTDGGGGGGGGGVPAGVAGSASKPAP